MLQFPAFSINKHSFSIVYAALWNKNVIFAV